MSTVESLEAEVAELRARLERVSPTPIKPKSETVEKYLEMALTRMSNDPKLAAGLFLRWCEQDSEVAKSLEPIVEEAIELRMAALVKPEQEVA